MEAVVMEISLAGRDTIQPEELPLEMETQSQLGSSLIHRKELQDQSA